MINIKTSGKVGIVLFIVILTLLALVIIFLRQEKAPVEPNIPINGAYTPPANWVISQTEGRAFYYPPTLDTEYIQLTDWPPALQILEESFACTPAGEEIERAGKTELITIGGRKYCRTTTLEGAAGSTYGLYAYAFPQGEATAILTFGLRFPECANYDKPQNLECQNERDTFDIDSVLDNIATSLKIRE